MKQFLLLVFVIPLFSFAQEMNLKYVVESSRSGVSINYFHVSKAKEKDTRTPANAWSKKMDTKGGDKISITAKADAKDAKLKIQVFCNEILLAQINNSDGTELSYQSVVPSIGALYETKATYIDYTKAKIETSQDTTTGEEATVSAPEITTSNTTYTRSQPASVHIAKPGPEDWREFHIDMGVLVWQKVFETEYSKEEVIQNLKRKGIFSDIEQIGDSYGGTLKEFDIDFKGAGYSEMKTPMYLARKKYRANVLIEFKEGRYRVTVRNFVGRQEAFDYLSYTNETGSLEDYVLKKKNTEFRKPFLGEENAGLISFTLRKLFTVIMTQSDSDW